MKKIREKLKYFWSQRYGYDELSYFICFLSLILLLLSLIRVLHYLLIPALILLLIVILRALSKKSNARYRERNFYLKLRNKVLAELRLIKDKIKNRKTTCYFKCPKCKTVVRVPKSLKGKTIVIKCPKCTDKFERKIR